MTRVLFICHGNICRSPMAEFVMKDLVRRRGEGERFYITSCAVSREEIGNDLHYGTRAKLRQMGVPFEKRAAVQLTRADYAAYDLLIGMDRANLQNMRRICGGDPEGKLSLLLEHAGRSGDVADPWYTGDFEATWRDVLEGCEALLKELRRGK